MNDTPTAPAPSAPPPAQNQPNPPPQAQNNLSEVALDTNQTSSPNPISNTPPEKPPLSRRDAIQAAFDRANKPQEMRGKPADKVQREPVSAPKAAEAKAGHNKPPEPIEKEGINLKKRPDEQTPRGERGRFAPRQPAEEQSADGGLNAPFKHPEQTAPKPLPENTPFREPPPRMAEHAKADWADTPETVRGEVHRMHQEFGKAYSSIRPIARRFQPIAHFHQMAQQHGTTLEQALTNYIGMEAQAAPRPGRRARHHRQQSGPDGPADRRRDRAARHRLPRPEPVAGAAQADAAGQPADGGQPADRRACTRRFRA